MINSVYWYSKIKIRTIGTTEQSRSIKLNMEKQHEDNSTNNSRRTPITRRTF